ncbi:hypothetical protein DFJ63DRAFT_282130 [Scheffersomyces coipomensis]|uniref:uncharacterized protein n=1 Tax=Scheffersomyces coipomensis TaxID=1788519 RepID=UPI00315D3E83
MSKARKLQTEVVERPDDFTIPAPNPNEISTIIQPFEYWNEASNNERNVLVLLNQSIEGINLQRLWDNTELHICADGGANRLYDYFANEYTREDYIPQFIVGDFDSIRKEVRLYYAKRGAKVIPQLTQYSTDFTKAMNTIQAYYFSPQSRQDLQVIEDTNNGIAELLESHNVSNQINHRNIRVYILSGIGGRFDQTIHSISQLYILNQSVPYLQLFFITTSDIIFLIQKGKSLIKYPSKEIIHINTNVPSCGLLPLGNTEVIISSLGLKYDVTDWPSSMLGNVSSSNGISGTDGVILDVSDAIVMNIETCHSS